MKTIQVFIFVILCSTCLGFSFGKIKDNIKKIVEKVKGGGKPKAVDNPYLEVPANRSDIQALVTFATDEYNRRTNFIYLHVPSQILQTAKARDTRDYHLYINFVPTSCMKPPKKNYVCIAKTDGIEQKTRVDIKLNKENDKVLKADFESLKFPCAPLCHF